MSIGSGLASQIGFGIESGYGTRAVPSKFLPAAKITPKRQPQRVQGMGLGAGRLLPLGSQYVETTRDAAISVEFDALMTQGLGRLVQQLMGTTVAPVQQAGTAGYLQVHTLADVFGKSLTVQAGLPDRAGTVRPHDFIGCKVTSGEFKFAPSEAVQATFELNAQDVKTDQTLAVAAYSTGVRPLVGTDTLVKIGASLGSEASVTGITGASVKFERGMQDGSYYFGGAGLKAEPVLNTLQTISGTLSSEYVDKTILVDRFYSNTPFSLVLESTGPLIAGAVFHVLRITLPQVFLTDAPQDVDGADVMSGDFPFTATQDAAGNVPKIEIISTDVTL